MRKRIGLDVDGVLMDFNSAFHNEAELVLGRKLLREKTTWDLKGWGITRAEKRQVWEHAMAQEDWFYLYLDALPGVTRYLPKLTRLHEVYFISARMPTAGSPIEYQTAHQISDLGVEFPTVIIAEDKGPIAAALNLDIFLDDKYQNLMRIAGSSPHTEIYLMDVYQNEYPVPERWHCVHSFEEFYKQLNESA